MRISDWSSDVCSSDLGVRAWPGGRNLSLRDRPLLMPDFSRRSTTPERMDTETVDYPDFRACLHHLAMVNRLTLAGRPTLGWLDQAVVGMRPGTALSKIGRAHV